ncbi:TrkH family potassium uptake protein [Romboutsia lituseburensis]|uniref:TrkH family potassium uptake protein n=1 Tax=Romboutsia lituseburensis TaxID=1537 RepID=UPI0022EA12AA|nr:potassium transporter TrkG [Romboutsia lituseburensis]
MKAAERNINDVKVISYYTGYIVIGTALLMLIPILTSIILKEYEPLIDFIISINISLIIGFGLILIGNTNKDKIYMEWKHGLIVASLSWILLMILCAIPYYLSGHMKSFLDACYDVISGFTTTGVFLLQDIDHLSVSLNLWRHILTFVGGQGMVVLAIMFLSSKTQGAYKMYVGEGKDVELAPNTRNTTRLIWIISLLYFAIGTFVLWINGMFIGLKPMRSLYHAACIFVSAWSTGGFSPMSQNMLYYHSFSYEIVTVIFLVLGALNFGLHYAIWKGNKKEIYKNIEIQTFTATILLTSFFIVKGLARLNVYPNATAIFRKGVYGLLSAHTTTGFMNLYARQFALEWGDFAILVMIIAMLFGGCACSTAGGFKALRIGIVVKGLIADIKKSLISDRRVKTFKYHHLKEHTLDSDVVKSSALIIILYMILFLGGTMLGCYYGYPMLDSAFESASVTGNVGLSIGITSITMPNPLKVYYIIAMYLGRLEFMAVFALIGFTIGGIKKLCIRK